MGVSSCGKTAVGERLAAELHAPFVEGDKLHPPANIEKMSSGIALNDDDRWPWLDRIGLAMRGDAAIVASCSALKKSYRQRLAKAAQRPVIFVFLHGTRELLAARISARKHHFMPPSLLDSQLAALEPLDGEEEAIVCDIRVPVAEIVARVVAELNAAGKP
jgi:gluconokinase